MSVYKYFRPLMVYCYMVGQFSANKVLSETADELEFKYMKVPLIMCAVNVTFSFCTVVHVFLGDTFNKTPITFHHLALTTLYVLIMVWSLLFGSKCLIRGFKSVDRLRKTSSSDLRFQLNIPAQFLLLTCLLLCLYHLLVIFVVTRFNVPLYKKMIFIIFYLLHPSSAYRQALTLSCLYGICGHVVQETVVCWRRYCLRNDRSFRYVGNFCRLVLAQTEILTSLNGILENYLVVFLIARYIFTCISMLFYIKFSETATVNSIDLLTWSIMITVLALCVDSTAIQFKKFTNEVLEMATSDIKFRDSVKVRLLLYQIHSNSGGFTAAGFTAVKTKLLLLFLSLGIDYLILLRQNEGYLKELLGLTHSNTAATPT